MRSWWVLAVVTLAMCGGELAAQDPKPDDAAAGVERKVEIRSAQTMKPLRRGEAVIMRLIGSVVLEHEGALLYCDSAYVYQDNNSFDAYGNVRIEGEESQIVGSALYYEGETKSGKIIGSPVEMVDKESGARLWSDSLFFNVDYKNAHFLTGGRVESSDYRVLSQRGYYTSSPSRTSFAGDVVIRGADVNVVSDSVVLYRDDGELHFFSHTRIHQDSVFLCGDSGIYNKESQQLRVLSNVSLRWGANTLFSDRLQLDRETGHALALGRAAAVDSTGDVRLYGNYLELWQKEGRALATLSPLAYSVDTTSSPADTLYLRADTLIAWRDTLSRIDTARNAKIRDTVWHARALYAVRAYSGEQQAVADSMYYNGIDSTLTLYRSPAPYVWMQDMQAYAKSIVAYLGKQRIDSVDMAGDVFVAQHEGESTYNQINGQRVRAWLDSTGIRFVKVREEGKVIFFMRDDGKLVGVNKVSAPAFNAWLRNKEIQDVTFYSKATSDVIPYRDAKLEDKLLPGFAWQDTLQPKSKEDVVPAWIDKLEFFAVRRAAIPLWETLDSAIFAIPWESGTSKIPKLPAMPSGLRNASAVQERAQEQAAGVGVLREGEEAKETEAQR